jgi:hypothetical protein
MGRTNGIKARVIVIHRRWPRCDGNRRVLRRGGQSPNLLAYRWLTSREETLGFDAAPTGGGHTSRAVFGNLHSTGVKAAADQDGCRFAVSMASGRRATWAFRSSSHGDGRRFVSRTAAFPSVRRASLSVEAFPPAVRGDPMAVKRRAVDRVGPVLEVIDKGRCSEAHPIPLLFVHGGEHAAWCWDEHFLDFFADKGYRALALSVRGHGGSSNSKRLRSCSIGDVAR